MPSSISSSKTKKQYWLLSLLAGVLLSLILLGFFESFWRSRGNKPDIIDDVKLWSINRSKVDKYPESVVLLGASRMQVDFNINTFQKLYPNLKVINLSIDGLCANSTLKDLLDDEKFSGIILVDITDECLADEPETSQQSFVDYYYNNLSLNIELNRKISTILEKQFVVIDPYFNLINVAGYLAKNHRIKPVKYIRMDESRQRFADYTKIDLNKHKEWRVKSINERYAEMMDYSPDEWLKRALRLNNDIKRFIGRNGKVAYIRFPVTGEQLLLDEQKFPRKQYWDKFAMFTTARAIHFSDYPTLNKFECPDYSHIDYKDTFEFTKALIDILISSGILPPISKNKAK